MNSEEWISSAPVVSSSEHDGRLVTVRHDQEKGIWEINLGAANRVYQSRSPTILWEYLSIKRNIVLPRDIFERQGRSEKSVVASDIFGGSPSTPVVSLAAHELDAFDRRTLDQPEEHLRRRGGRERRSIGSERAIAASRSVSQAALGRNHQEYSHTA